jgi:AraC-like DNA-binding protein
MSELYTDISIFAISGFLLACSVMLLFAFIPANALLGNYRKARYMMAGAYLFFVAVNAVEYLSGDPSAQSVPLVQTVTLAIAASQAFLFTFAMLALVEVRFPGWRYIFREATVVLLFIAALFTVYACCSEAFFSIVFYGFSLLYALLLVRYTVLFIKSYRQFRYRMDNYYSDEAARLRWVAVSFFASLAIGVTALLSVVSMSTLVVLFFSIVSDIFYTFFAVRLINYAHQFQVIECAMDDGAPEEEDTALPDSDAKFVNSDAFVLLEKRIEQWIADKGFIRAGITIDTLAVLLATNRSYLSRYANICKKQTFREWINALRMEEAQRLLRQHPEMSLNEIASRVGFSDKSNFIRRFIRHTNASPKVWRKTHL